MERSITITPKTLWTVLLMAIGVFVAWHLRNFIMVVVVSVIIASFIEAGTRTLKRFRVPRIASVFLFYVLGFGMIFGVLYLVVPLFANEIADFINLFPETSSVRILLSPLAEGGFNVNAFTAIFTDPQIVAGGNVASTLSGVFGGLVNGLLVVIISFYLAVQEKGIEQFLRVVFPEKYEEYAVDVWQRVERKIGYWFGGQVLVAILIGLVTYIGLFLMGVPYALILAALATIFVFVPFGTAISTAPAVALGYLGGGVGLALQIFLFYGIVHYIESYFLQPYILHRTIGMPMLVILLSVIACFELFGVIGILVAIPLAVLVLELVYDHRNFRKGLGAKDPA